ncbi:MAG: hypothetical protein RL427_1784 [Bacteroidota bacterium]|jgi:hypothetical protein
MQKNKSTINALTIGYFIIAFLEVFSEYAKYKPIIFVFKPLITVVLVSMYLVSSSKRNTAFILVLLTSLITNILFIPGTPNYLLYAIIVFTVHRIVVIYLVLKLQKISDFIPVVIGTAPFLLIFFYLFMETTDIPESSYYILIVQNLLISLFAGLSLSSYVMNDNKQNSILLISALLFVMLQFTVFIEKYYLTDEYQNLFRPLAMSLNALAFYSFYKYVITAELKQ